MYDERAKLHEFIETIAHIVQEFLGRFAVYPVLSQFQNPLFLRMHAFYQALDHLIDFVQVAKIVT